MRRRFFLKGSAVASMVAFFGGFDLKAKTVSKSQLLGFEAVDASVEDRVIVLKGYEAKVLVSWGRSNF